MFIQRNLLNYLEHYYPPKGQAVVIFGARQAGKTTILRQLLNYSVSTWINGDVSAEAETLSFKSTSEAQSFLRLSGNIVIDEAQHIPQIGKMLKLLVDANELEKEPMGYIPASFYFCMLNIDYKEIIKLKPSLFCRSF